jgi:hypothetical protein
MVLLFVLFSSLLRLAQTLAQKLVVIHARLVRSDLGEADRIDGRDVQNKENITAKAHHLAPVARHDGRLLFRTQAEPVEIRLLVLFKGLPVEGIHQSHRHLVDPIAAQGPFAVEQERFANAIASNRRPALRRTMSAAGLRPSTNLFQA